MNRTWVKLGATAPKGANVVTLDEKVEGWRTGDRVIITATDGANETGGSRRRKSGAPEPTRDNSTRTGYRTDTAPGLPVQTEERIIEAIDGDHARPPARKYSPGRRRLSRRGGQPEPQCRDRIGRPRWGAGPHDVSRRVNRLDRVRGVSSPGEGRGAGQVQHPFSQGRRHDARELGDRGVDLGYKATPMDHDPRHELP